jgi:hypothetical protein
VITNKFKLVRIQLCTWTASLDVSPGPDEKLLFYRVSLDIAVICDTTVHFYRQLNSFMSKKCFPSYQLSLDHTLDLQEYCVIIRGIHASLLSKESRILCLLSLVTCMICRLL